MLREKKFKQTIPQVKVEENEEITCEKADAAMRRSINFWSVLQSPHGHWPAQNAGVMFYVAPLVSSLVVVLLFIIFLIIIYIYIYNVNNFIYLQCGFKLWWIHKITLKSEKWEIANKSFVPNTQCGWIRLLT